jgi:hypothetical protein
LQRLTTRQRVTLLVALQGVLDALAQFIEDSGGVALPPAVRSGVVLVTTTISALLIATEFRDEQGD